MVSIWIYERLVELKINALFCSQSLNCRWKRRDEKYKNQPQDEPKGTELKENDYIEHKINLWKMQFFPNTAIFPIEWNRRFFIFVGNFSCSSSNIPKIVVQYNEDTECATEEVRESPMCCPIAYEKQKRTSKLQRKKEFRLDIATTKLVNKNKIATINTTWLRVWWWVFSLHTIYILQTMSDNLIDDILFRIGNILFNSASFRLDQQDFVWVGFCLKSTKFCFKSARFRLDRRYCCCVYFSSSRMNFYVLQFYRIAKMIVKLNK